MQTIKNKESLYKTCQLIQSTNFTLFKGNDFHCLVKNKRERNIRDDRRAVSEAAIYNGRLALLSIERLEGTAGPIGILAAGNYLDQATMDEFAVAQDLNIILSLNDKEVVSSTVHKNIPPQAMAK